VASRICSKDLLDEGVLGRQGKEVILFEEAEVFFAVGSVGKDFKTGIENGGWGSAGDDVLGAVWDIEEGVILLVFKSRPDKLGGWGTWDRSNRW